MTLNLIKKIKEKNITKPNKPSRPMRIIMAALLAPVVILTLIAILEITLPVKISDKDPKQTANNNLTNLYNFKPPTTKNVTDTPDLSPAKTNRKTPLFKPASAIRDKPTADKTIERIKAQLSLQCIMNMAGQNVVYINIKGLGLKKLAVGDSVNDLFKVININEDSVQISIVGHNVFLRL